MTRNAGGQAVAEAVQRLRGFVDAKVENFWCFNPRDRNAQGELGVVAYQHDETFGLPTLLGTKNAQHFRDFSAHIVTVIDEFIDTYAEA